MTVLNYKKIPSAQTIDPAKKGYAPIHCIMAECCCKINSGRTDAHLYVGLDRTLILVWHWFAVYVQQRQAIIAVYAHTREQQHSVTYVTPRSFYSQGVNTCSNIELRSCETKPLTRASDARFTITAQPVIQLKDSLLLLPCSLCSHQHHWEFLSHAHTHLPFHSGLIN